jgi:hypothetical protein
MLACAAVKAALVLVALTGVAHGNSAEVYGLGSRAAGLGGAVAASVDDFAAAYYNPAGLALGRGKRASFGLMAAASNLEKSGDRMPLSDAWRFVLGASAPAPLGGPLAGRIHLGIALTVLPDNVIRVVAHEPEDPFYPFYERTERLVILPAIAVRAHDRVAVGMAVNVLAALDGEVVTVEGPARALEPRVDEEIPLRARLHAGTRVEILPRWTAALVWRQAFSVPFATTTRNTVAGENIDLDIRAEGLYTPMQLVLGNLVRLDEHDLALTLDVTWSRWSAWDGPYVTVRSDLPLVDPIEGELPDVPWKDTIAARAGGEHTRGPWTFRSGYGFETSPVPRRQRGVTNLLDGPKHTVSLGAGWAWGALRIDAHLQMQLVDGRTIRKRLTNDADAGSFDGLRDEDGDLAGTQVSNPGWPNLRSGGQVFSGGVTVGVGL